MHSYIIHSIYLCMLNIFTNNMCLYVKIHYIISSSILFLGINIFAHICICEKVSHLCKHNEEYTQRLLFIVLN